MIEMACLVASPLIQLDGTTITLQAQDQGAITTSQIIGIILSGAVVGIINYLLQKRSFNKEDKARELDRRMTAYSDLVGSISKYEVYEARSYDLRFSTAMVANYASENIKPKAKECLKKLMGTDNPELRVLLVELKSQIVDELYQSSI